MYSVIFVFICIYILYLFISFKLKIKNLKNKNSEILDEIIKRDYEIKYLKEHIKNS